LTDDKEGKPMIVLSPTPPKREDTAEEKVRRKGVVRTEEEKGAWKVKKRTQKKAKKRKQGQGTMIHEEGEPVERG